MEDPQAEAYDALVEAQYQLGALANQDEPDPAELATARAALREARARYMTMVEAQHSDA